MTFAFHRAPRAHQATDFERFKDAPYFGLLYEPRCGKTKPVIDIFHYRYARGEADLLLAIAFPNGTHRIWVDELEKEFPPELLKQTHTVVWQSGKTTKGAAREHALAARSHPGPVVVAMNCEALIHPTGWDYVEWLLKRRRAIIVADEASWSANWSRRTQRLLALGRRPSVVSRVITDGTLSAEGPEDLYFPTNFLTPGALGYETKAAFRGRYVRYKTDEHGNRVRGYNRRTGTEFDIIEGVQNVEELSARLATFSTRVLREQVSDAPPKTYQTRYFQLTKIQRKVYDELRDEYVAELAGDQYTAVNVLLRMTRLQMVARNYWPPEKLGIPCSNCAQSGYMDSGDECPLCAGMGAAVHQTELRRIDPSHNPAADALAYELEHTPHPMIVWTRFRQDANDVLDTVRASGRNPFFYTGDIPENEREKAYQSFRTSNDPRDVIIGTISSGLSRGKDLTRAGTLFYYSNEFGLRARQQSEDRAEGLTRQVSTGVVDLVAEDTRDLAAIEALRRKDRIARLIMGDPERNWL